VSANGGSAPRVPRFSAAYLDRSADPGRAFYDFATGAWRRDHPIPADKSIWGAFNELIERNNWQLREILEAAADGSDPSAPRPRRQVGDFYASALDQPAREAARFTAIEPLLREVNGAGSTAELFRVAGRLHDAGAGGLFYPFVYPDKKHSSVYAFYLYQGGLSLPDREYYLADGFAPQRAAYLRHVERMLGLLGWAGAEAREGASVVLTLETELARHSRSAAEVRQQVENHHPYSLPDFLTNFPGPPWSEYLADRRAGVAGHLVVGQPEFFTALAALLESRPADEWRTYLTWHLLHAHAPYLHAAVEDEDFDFFHRNLQGQPEPEPPWRRAATAVDEALGEALGQLYVERHFGPEARARMGTLVNDLREVFRDRLSRLEWMTDSTRAKALAKFDRFRTKIGHPERYRDYSTVVVRRDDYAGNHLRAAAFEVRRDMDRIGQPVDRDEWGMTPPTVNAYFNATQNEIVFPAGILQPPFFDTEMDDAVNYGGIGAVIGHEITHGYDDQGRRFDADGNLADWWSEADAREFEARAKEVVELYGRVEVLPGAFVNGTLTLGENIADFGGLSLAYEALERRLAADPARRVTVDGLTPEQRFFVSWAQVWRENCREPEKRRRLTIDPHAPGPVRATTPAENHPEFGRAFPGSAAPGRAPPRIW
jgi:putative endopeptidase